MWRSYSYSGINYGGACAHEDIRNVTKHGDSPLQIARTNEHFEVVTKFLIRLGMAARVLRRNLRLGQNWYPSRGDERRLALLSWAHDAVTIHTNPVVVVFLGSSPPPLLSSSSSQYSVRYPKHTKVRFVSWN